MLLSTRIPGTCGSRIRPQHTPGYIRRAPHSLRRRLVRGLYMPLRQGLLHPYTPANPKERPPSPHINTATLTYTRNLYRPVPTLRPRQIAIQTRDTTTISYTFMDYKGVKSNTCILLLSNPTNEMHAIPPTSAIPRPIRKHFPTLQPLLAQ